MAFGLSTGSSGDYNEIVKFDARAGRLKRVDRDGSGAKEEVDITSPAPKFLVDFGSVEVGYIHFPPSAAPSFNVVPLGNSLPASPSPDHKQGFRLKIFAPKLLGGVREWSTNSKIVVNAFDALHNTFTAAPEAAEGKIPVVEMVRTDAIKIKTPQGTSTFYAPTFEIVGWNDRPAELGARTVPPPVKQIAKAPTPPAPETAPQASRELEDSIPF